MGIRRRITKYKFGVPYKEGNHYLIMDRDDRTDSEEKRTRCRRILFIISALYGGGAERVCCTLASAFAKKYDVAILYRNEIGCTYPLDSRVRVCKMDFKDDGPGHPIQKLLRPYYTIKSCRKMKDMFRPDVSISFLYHYNVLNILSGGKCRLICSERCNPKKTDNGKNFWITQYLYRKADHVVFQSEMIKEMYDKKVKAHSSVIPNPVQVEIHASEKRVHRVINLGRLVPQKNQSMLIRSFAEFHKQFSDYILTIYGEGPLRDDLVRLTEELGIGDCVELPGNVQNVHQSIADTEMFVLSSDFEGLSNALLECMSMGIACISTACEGSVDVISNGQNGLLVPIGDEGALTGAMVRLARDENLRRRLETQASNDMAAFSPEVITNKWEDLLFHDLISV